MIRQRFTTEEVELHKRMFLNYWDALDSRIAATKHKPTKLAFQLEQQRVFDLEAKLSTVVQTELPQAPLQRVK